MYYVVFLLSHAHAELFSPPATRVLSKLVHKPASVYSLKDLPLIVISVERRGWVSLGSTYKVFTILNLN